MTYDLAWLTNPTAKRCILVEVIANVAGTETTFYLSDKGYVTGAGDTPANTVYLPIIAGGINVSESISLDGSASLSYGDIELYNLNGERDDWLSYIWTNRAISVYVGDVSWVRADFQIIFNGIISDLDSKSVDRINIKIVDKLQRLNTPVTEAKLGGSTENAYDILPLTFGEVFNVTPLLTDPANLVYQVHNGSIERIIEVRDNGVPLSAYTTSLSTGKFTLTAAPAGTITASVQGYKATTYINTIAEIIQAIVLNYGKASTRFVSNDLDLTNLASFEAAHTQAVGVYLTDRVNVISIIQELASSIGAVVVMSRLGKLQLLQINIPPTGTPTVITTTDIIESSLRIVERLEVKSSSKIGYCKNWTVQENLQTGIPDEHKKMLSNEYLIVTQSNNTTSTAYKLDEEPVQRNTLLLSSIDAGAESLRDIAIATSVRTVYGFEGFSQLMLLKLGDTITLTNPRFGLSAGKLGTVIKLEPDWINSTVYVEALCSVDILTADTTAPSAPGTLTVVSSSPTTARFDWGAATDNVGVVGYNIYSGGAIYAFLGNITYYNAIGLDPATQYQFTVKARDKAGNIGTASNTVTITMPSNSVDFAISDLTASADGSLTATIKNQGTVDYPGGEAAPLVAPVLWYKDNVLLNNGELITPLAKGAETIVTESGVKVPIANGTFTIKATINEAGDYTGEVNPNGLLSKSITISAVDTTPPTVPTNLATSPISISQVNLSWSASTDNVAVTGYEIWRDGGYLTQTASLSYNNTGLVLGTTYQYQVLAYDAAGNKSDLCSVVTGTTLSDTTAPTVPSNVSATAVSPYAINLTWTASTDAVGVRGYDVYRGGVKINSAEITTVTSYSDTGLTPATLYSYTVKATDTSGNTSAASTAATATTSAITDTTAPTAPSSLAGTVRSSNQIDYTWTTSTDAVGVTAYKLYNNGSYVLDISAPATNYSFLNLTASTQYVITLKATDAAGNLSTASNTDTHTTLSVTPDFIPTDITATTAGVFTISAKNIGTAAVTIDVNCDCYVDGSYMGWMQFPGGTVWPINQINTVTGAALGAITAGSHTLKVILDATNTQTELNETNNTFEKVYIVPGSPDTVAPTVPQNLTASAVSTSQINCGWSASTDVYGVAGYRLYDGTTQIGGDLGSSTLSYSHSGLVAGSTHTYQVLAFDGAGNASAKSTSATATTTVVYNAIYISTTGNDTTGTGTLANPYRTWLKASQVSSPGKTIYARGGTYNERFIVQNSGTAGNEITYSSYPGEVAIISGTGLPYLQWNGAIQMYARNYITIRDITINDSQNYAIRCETNCGHITVDNVRVNRANNSAFSALTGTFMTVKNCNFRQISKTQNQTAPAGSAGIQEGISFNNVQDFWCYNNIVYDSENEGIDAKSGCTRGEIYNNDVSGTLQRMGIYIDGYGSGCSYINVYNNRVHDVIDTDTRYPGLVSSGNGISIGAERGAAVSNINIYNNLVYNFCDSGIRLSHWVDGTQTPPTYTNINIINNTIYNTNYLNQNSWSPHAGICIDGTSGNNVNVVIKNNIMSNIQNDTAGHNNMYIAAGISLTNTNNLFFGGTSAGSSPVIGNPLFTNTATADFRLLNGSPAINAGNATGTPTTDIVGTTRTGNPDIGCYEKV